MERVKRLVRSRSNSGKKAPWHPAPPPGARLRPPRLVPRDKGDAMVAVGACRPWLGDLYHRTLTLPWSVFLLAGTALYLGLNVVFALLYLIERGAIANARPGS